MAQSTTPNPGSDSDRTPEWTVSETPGPAYARMPGTTAATEIVGSDAAYARIAEASDFAELRRRYRKFAFPATLAFMVWYITYVICNNWARDFMDTPVVGHINIAVVFGLLQFASTFAIAFFYARHAGRALDPLSTRLREQFERETDR